MGFGAPHHALPPPILDDGLRGLRAWPVVVVEWTGSDRAVELRAIGGKLRLEAVEDVLRQSPWIGCGLHHQRRHRADDGGLRHATFAVACEVVNHFAAAGRMADMDCILK